MKANIDEFKIGVKFGELLTKINLELGIPDIPGKQQENEQELKESLRILEEENSI